MILDGFRSSSCTGWRAYSNSYRIPALSAPTTEIRTQQHFIGGAFVDGASGETFETLNPTTNEVLALAASGNAADVGAAGRAARTAFDEGPWPRMTAKERAKVLRRIADLIREHASEFIQLECLDIG